jgi:hypothetical protein
VTQAPAVTRAQVLAFRLAGHHLAEPLSPDRLPEAAGACGLQDTPPGSAPLGLLARVDGLTPDAVDAARAEGGTLLEAWSIRASPHLVPSGDLAVFTLGLLPTSEAGWAAASADVVFT